MVFRLGFGDLYSPAGLSEARESPRKLTLKGQERPTCAAAAEGPAGPAPGFRCGLHYPPPRPGPRQRQGPATGVSVWEAQTSARAGVLSAQTLRHVVTKALGA